jgi:aspartokinase
MPVVSGFDGIYDPGKEFKEIMQSPVEETADRRYANVYRTSLGRGGSDLTATFLGLALGADYVGFCKETAGVLTADDMLVGDEAQTIETLSYDLATEAGNIYARAVEPVRASGVPVHIFDPARPTRRTVISDAKLDDGLYIVERPIETVNVHVGTIPDEPGELSAFVDVFGALDVNVEEVRHQRVGTDAIVVGDAESVQLAVSRLDDLGLRPVAS